MKQFVVGIGDVYRGLGVLRAHPRLWRWVIAPAAITLVLLAVLIGGVWLTVDPAISWLGEHAPGTLGHVASRVHARIVLGLSITALLLFLPIAGAIAGPFHERLSAHVERAVTGLPPGPEPGFLHGAAISLLHGARRLVAGVFGALAVLLLGLVPVVGSYAAPVLAAWLAARSAAYDCYDAVLARRALGFRTKLDFLSDHPRSLGLGATVAALLLVPGLGLLALGVGAAGATVVVVSDDRS